MTASRRQFTFGALALALAGDASAGGAPQQAVQAPKRALSFRPRYTAARRGGELHIGLSLINEGDSVDVIVAWGSRPGPALTAFVDIEGERTELVRAFDVDRKEIMSRMGPRPRFAPVASGGELEVGTYRFAWIPGVPDLPVAVALRVETSEGSVALPEELVTWKPVGT